MSYLFLEQPVIHFGRDEWQGYHNNNLHMNFLLVIVTFSSEIIMLASRRIRLGNCW